MKVCVGTAVLAAFISLDGDVLTTYLVTCSGVAGSSPSSGDQSNYPAFVGAAGKQCDEHYSLGRSDRTGSGGRCKLNLSGLRADDSGMVLGTLFVCFMGYRWGMKERARLGCA